MEGVACPPRRELRAYDSLYPTGQRCHSLGGGSDSARKSGRLLTAGWILPRDVSESQEDIWHVGP